MPTSKEAPQASGKAVPSPVEVAPPDFALVVVTNAPDQATAERIARALVDERLAACVNLLAPCLSVYRWQGAVESAQEIPMLVKTTRSRFAALGERLRELHPYELPELLAFRPDAGLPAYLDWVLASCRREFAGQPSRSQRATSSEK